VNIGNAYLVINKALSFTSSCSPRYVQATNQLFLMNDAGTAWLGPITPGSGATLQNAQCVLDGATSSASITGANLTVNYGLKLQPGFTGAKNTYVMAEDSAHNVRSGWKQLGIWTVQ
jgi:hypothetical protein